MQTTLLGVAIALILALLSALIAPLVIDWNHYRYAFETEASRLTGLNVRINGTIDARLLPSPVVTLRDVAVGDAGHAPQMRAGMLKLELALGPLLRGKVQASEVRLVGPQLDLALDRSGRLDLPKLAPSFRPEALSISRFSIEDGRVVFSDAASASRLVLQKLYFNGDVRSFAGPFNGEGAAVVGDALYGYRIVGNRAENGGTKLRLTIDPADRPLTTLFEGTLALEQGVPQFDGSMTLARPVGATLANGQRVVSEPWHATAALQANPAAASLKNLMFRYGPEERAVNLNGSADLTFGAHPHLQGSIAAMQVDVDRALADPDLTNRPPLVAVRSFLQAFAAGAKLPVPARLALSIGALTVGGTTIEALQGDLNFDRAGWSLDGVQFRAPGMTEVNVSGKLSGTPQGFSFTGPAALTSADTDALVAWLNGRNADQGAGEAKALRAQGEVTIASERIAVERLTAAFGREQIGGRFVYGWQGDNRPARLDAALRAAELDVDAVRTFISSALGSDGLAMPQEATLALDIGKATLGGVEAKAVDAQVKFDAGKLQIDRFSVGDLGGAKLDVSGRIDELSSQPRGQLALDLDARSLDGLSAIAAKFAPQAANSLQQLAGHLAPAKVHAVLNVQHAANAGSTADLTINGDLAAMRLVVAGKASGEPAHADSATVQIDSRLDADDGSALVALLGLDRFLGVDQLPGRLTLALAGPLNGDLRVDSEIATSGLDSAIHGTLRLSKEGLPRGQLQIQAAAGDLRPLHQIMTGQPGSAVPVSARAALTIEGSELSFVDLAGTVGKTSVHGHVAVNWTNPIGVEGDIAGDEVDAAALSGLLLGGPDNSQTGAAPWSSQKIGAGAFAATNGALTVKFGRVVLNPTLVANDLAGTVHFRRNEIALDGMDGRLAGGRLTGSLAFRRNADQLAVHSDIAIAGASAATLAGPAFNVAGGQLSVTLHGDGSGATAAGLIGSLHGGGTVTLKDAQFAGLDPAAFAAAMQAAGPTGPIDMAKVQTAVSNALANGRLTVPAGNAAVTITAGAINLNHVVLQAQAGAELALDGYVDLGAMAVNARMTLSEAPPANALIAARPELAVSVKGSLAAPQRTLDIAALTSWLTARATELQTRRIESIEADRRQGAVGQAPHPAAPEVRIVPPGSVVEFAPPADTSAEPAGAARALERLAPQPPAPQPPAPLVPEQNRSGAANPKPAPTPIGAPAAHPPTPIKPGDAHAPPRPAKPTATAGASEPIRRRSVPQPAEAIIPRTE